MVYIIVTYEITPQARYVVNHNLGKIPGMHYADCQIVNWIMGRCQNHKFQELAFVRQHNLRIKMHARDNTYL